MSMWLNIARISAKGFEQISADPSLVEALFFGSRADAKAARKTLDIRKSDCGGVDYLSAARALSAMAEAMGEPEPDDDAVLDLPLSGELSFDAGYGPAFYVAPDDIAGAGDSIICHMDEDVADLIARAVEGGDYLVGVIS